MAKLSAIQKNLNRSKLVNRYSLKGLNWRKFAVTKVYLLKKDLMLN